MDFRNKTIRRFAMLEIQGSELTADPLSDHNVLYCACRLIAAMDNDEQSAARYQFSDVVDILATFERLVIEHLEVSTERTIVIYSRTIFNFDVLTGQLDTAQTVKVEVFDISPDLDTNTDPVSLIEHLIGELATTVSVDWERQG